MENYGLGCLFGAGWCLIWDVNGREQHLAVMNVHAMNGAVLCVLCVGLIWGFGVWIGM